MTNCLLCTGEMSPRFSCRDYRRPDDKSEFTVTWCEPCAIGRLAGDFTPETISTFYPPGYYTHSSEAGPATKFTKPQRALLHAAWRLDRGRLFHPSELPRGHRVCDIGCGNGNDLRLYRSVGFETFGVDPDPSALTAAADAGTILQGTAESLPADLPRGSFDVVHMSHVLEHCIDARKAIREASSLLAPNGTLVIEVPNNEHNDFTSTWPWSDIPRHLNFFTSQSLARMLESEGLCVTATHFSGFSRQYDPRWAALQASIADVIGGPRPAHGWVDLLLSRFARNELKYVSVRVHAILAL